MMFYLSKILWFFFQPSSLLVLLFAAGAAYALLGKARPALRLFASGAALYAVFGLSPLANLLLAPLELAANAAAAENLDGAAGIIVLGGAIAPTSSLAYGATHLNDSADRMIEALRLAARYPALPVLFSGGIAALHPRKDTETEAARAQRFFEAFNLVPPRLILEDRSRNTLENAVLSARMLQPKPGQKWISSPRLSTCQERKRFLKRKGLKSWRGPWTSGRTASTIAGCLLQRLPTVSDGLIWPPRNGPGFSWLGWRGIFRGGRKFFPVWQELKAQ